jgi:hypothetical protein
MAGQQKVRQEHTFEQMVDNLEAALDRIGTGT